MKIEIIILTLVVLVGAKSAKKPTSGFRRSIPNENDPHRTKYILLEDADGNIYYEDLTESTIKRRRPTTKDLKLYFYSRDTAETLIKENHLEEIKKLDEYDAKKPTYFIIHGFLNSYSSPVNVEVKKELLSASDCNIFVVDWSSYTKWSFYSTAKDAVPVFGSFIGDIINGIMEYYKVVPGNFKLIGHSLGAHLAGCAGARVNGLVDYIIVLDPAGPEFTKHNITERLDETDAQFVQAIHTDLKFGIEFSLGHADFYPNDGHHQPGCKSYQISYSHSRSYFVYAGSLQGDYFNSVACTNFDDYQTAKCDGNDISYFGTINVDKRASGDYFLITNSASPFALG